MNRQQMFVVLILILSLLLTSSVLAEVSDSGVEYDSELIGQFLISKWVHVTVDIKDFSNITIPNKNSFDFESKINERWNVYRNTLESVLSTLPEEEFQLKMKSEFGTFFSGNITKEGFDKLLNDERVRKIYAKKYIIGQSVINVKNIGFYLIPVILIVILTILLIKLNKKRGFCVRLLKWKPSS
jgi:hypothetical protein